MSAADRFEVPSIALASLTNAVEALYNVLYLIDLRADNTPEVRKCVELAAPAMRVLAGFVNEHAASSRKGAGSAPARND